MKNHDKYRECIVTYAKALGGFNVHKQRTWKNSIVKSVRIFSTQKPSVEFLNMADGAIKIDD